MAGYGNRTNTNISPDLTSSHNSTRLGLSTESHPYTGATDTQYGSAATHGTGFGNKTAPIPSLSESDSNELRLSSTDSSAGEREHLSGSVGGAGWGNKTGVHRESHDSTVGKLMEKAGHLVHNEGLAEKGRAKREKEGFGREGE